MNEVIDAIVYTLALVVLPSCGFFAYLFYDVSKINLKAYNQKVKELEQLEFEFSQFRCNVRQAARNLMDDADEHEEVE